MRLADYLERIQFNGDPAVNAETLCAIHHQHLQHIPYENLDVQLGRPLDFDPDRIFHKLVHERRGGWCYEMNGLFGWALTQIGFDVTRMSGGVMREQQGDKQLGNHLILEVDLAGTKWLADVGLGDGVRYPIPIRTDTYDQAGLQYSLTRVDGDYWRFHNQPFSKVTSFDFKHSEADEAELAEQCRWLQTDAQSPFKMALIANRFTERTIEIQLGKVHTTVTSQGTRSRVLPDLKALQSNLESIFGITQDISPAWDNIAASHEKHFAKPDP